jgi:hypothetical protein
MREITIKVIEKLNYKKFTFFGVTMQLNFHKSGALACMYITHIESGLTHYIEPRKANSHDSWIEE